MIKFNDKEFLSIEWVKKLQESGVEFLDSKYFIVDDEFIATKDEIREGMNIFPTYTLSELLYKLPEYVQNYGGLTFWKDAPFYGFCFKDKEETHDFYHECPIYSAARLLLYCAESEDLWYVKDVSGK